MRSTHALFAASLLALASPAGAADPGPRPAALGLGPFTWDFEAPGRMHDVAAKIVKIAWTFFPLALIAALAVEAFGHAPQHPRDYAAVTWRAVVVAILLLFYIPLFNGLMKHVLDPLAEAVTPVSGVAEFLRQSIEAAKGLPSSEADQVIAEDGLGGTAKALIEGEGFGGFFYDSLVSFLLLLAEGLIICIGKLGKVIAAVLFCLGPLALVATLPRPSRIGMRWFSHFITILSWPIFSGVLLSILVAMGRDGADTGGYLAAVVASLVTAGVALATPRLASHVVGGTLENLIASGYESAKGIQRDATSLGVREAVRSLVGGPGRGGGNGNGGGTGGGGSQWQPGVPQRIASALGSAIANTVRPPPPPGLPRTTMASHGAATNSPAAGGAQRAPTTPPAKGFGASPTSSAHASSSPIVNPTAAGTAPTGHSEAALNPDRSGRKDHP